MKLSQMKYDKLTDAMARISASFGSILEDDEITKLIGEIIKQGQKNAMKGYAMLFAKLVPVALKNKKAEFGEILAVLDDKTVDDVKEFTLTDIKRVIEESADRELLDFFKLLVGSTKTDAGT